MKKIRIKIMDGKYGRQYSTITKDIQWLNIKFVDYTPSEELVPGWAEVEADQIWVAPKTDKYKEKVFVKGNINIVQTKIDDKEILEFIE